MTPRVSKDADVCCDGVIDESESLNVGSKIRLTAHANDKDVATMIESLSNQIVLRTITEHAKPQ